MTIRIFDRSHKKVLMVIRDVCSVRDNGETLLVEHHGKKDTFIKHGYFWEINPYDVAMWSTGKRNKRL